MTKKYWINTISLEHVLLGIKGGFTQANHGSAQNIGRLQKGDYVLFYSPKNAFKGSKPLQAFTALGKVTDDKPYQAQQTESFQPFRRNLDFLEITQAPIAPLSGGLSFINNKTHWGMPFRRGLFEIPLADFRRITEAMEIDV